MHSFLCHQGECELLESAEQLHAVHSTWACDMWLLYVVTICGICGYWSRFASLRCEIETVK